MILMRSFLRKVLLFSVVIVLSFFIFSTKSQAQGACPETGIGLNAKPFGDRTSPDPLTGGFSECLYNGELYSFCPGGSYITGPGYCVDFSIWVGAQGNCCNANQTSCTTTDEEIGYCAGIGVSSDAISCDTGRACIAADPNLDTSNPGDFYCNCTNNGTNWWCTPGSDPMKLLAGNEGPGCADWAVPDTGRCSISLPSNSLPSFCDRSDGGKCGGSLSCVSQLSETIEPLKVHGEECEYIPRGDQCDTSIGLQCMTVEGTYRCAFGIETRGGVGVSESQSSCLWDFECVTQIGGYSSDYSDFECVDSNSIPCDDSQQGISCSCKLPENRSQYRCEWTPYDDASSSYYGRPAYCMYGFRTPDELRASDLVFACADNCGGLILQFAAWLQGWDGQHVSLRGFEAGQSDDGTYYTCVTGDFDGGIEATIGDCLNDQGLLTAYGGAAGGVIGALVPGFNIVTVPIGVVGGAAIGERVADAVFNCAPTIRGEVKLADGINACSADLRIEVDLTTEIGDLETSNDPYFICESNLIHNDVAFQACDTCMGNGGIWTSIGCISQDPKSLVGKLINIGVGILGGIFLLRVLAASFMLTGSQGDVKKTSEAKQMITEAIIGIIFVLFSVTILQFIGADVMKLPGFGG
jgi:hypothetical protein